MLPCGRWVHVPAARYRQFVLILALTIHAGMLGYSAAIHSPVIDEPAHLAAGISHWRFGDFSLYRVNPPLVRLVATAPLLATEVRTDWDQYSRDPTRRDEFLVGDDLIVANGARIFRLVTMARWACIPFSLVGAVVCYRWAKLLFGTEGGLVSAVLWCLSPTILGHGSLITPDVAGAALGLAACYAFFVWLHFPRWRSALVAGLALGAAEASKSTWIILFAALPVVWLLYRLVFPQLSRSPTIKQLLCIVALGWGLLVSLYGWQGMGVRLGSIPFHSNLFRQALCEPAGVEKWRVHATLAALPLPLPRDYVIGLDQQYKDLEGPNRSFLRGEWRIRGWHYYYAYGLAVKEPLAVLALAAASLLWWIALFGRARMRRPMSKRRVSLAASSGLMALCPTAVLIIASANTGMNHHVRYVMPVVPFLYILAGGLMTRSSPGHGWRRTLSSGLVACALISSLATFPHSLSYFSELVGGSRNGFQHLNNSNIDWGQDLLLLREWQRNRLPHESIYLAYFGRVNPAHAGIDYQLPPLLPASLPAAERAKVTRALKPGWYAVSVTLLQGRGYTIHAPDGQSLPVDENAVSYFQEFVPTDRVGYSIFLYKIEQQE